MAVEGSVTTPGAVRRLSLGQLLALLAVVAVIALFVYGLFSSQQSRERVESGAAPNFSFTTFDGKTMTLNDLRGKVVVVNFWATWCVECRTEAPALEQIWRKYQNQNVVFLGVDYLDQEPMNHNYLKEFNVTYPNGSDIQGRIYRAFRVQGLPETFVIDQSGKVSQVFIGATTEANLDTSLQKLLN